VTTPAVCACAIPAVAREKRMKTSFLESMSDPREWKQTSTEEDRRLTSVAVRFLA
jgi:hypothetical protein